MRDLLVKLNKQRNNKDKLQNRQSATDLLKQMQSGG